MGKDGNKRKRQDEDSDGDSQPLARDEYEVEKILDMKLMVDNSIRGKNGRIISASTAFRSTLVISCDQPPWQTSRTCSWWWDGCVRFEISEIMYLSVIFSGQPSENESEHAAHGGHQHPQGMMQYLCGR